MKKILATAMASVILGTGVAGTAQATDPEKDRQQIRAYFKKKNPEIPLERYKDGDYIYSDDKYQQFLAIMEFPPFEDDLDAGEALWNQDLAAYKECYGTDDPSKIRVRYPMYDEKRQEVVTLEQSINDCRTSHGLKPFKWEKGKIAQLSAYLAYEANGQKINVKIDSPGALKAYELGKWIYNAPRGQYGFSCATCHTYNAGSRIRTEIPSPQLGHTTHMPVYRAKWGYLGTFHKRLKGCVTDLHTKPWKAQSPEMKALEFYEAYIDNGLEINGPGYRQ